MPQTETTDEYRAQTTIKIWQGTKDLLDAVKDAKRGRETLLGIVDRLVCEEAASLGIAQGNADEGKA